MFSVMLISNFFFRITRTGAETGGIAMVRSPQPRPQAIASRRTAAVPVTSQAAGAVTSRNGKTQLQIVCQPETQHRARYQTEGSRGAVKDRSGNGFPVVKVRLTHLNGAHQIQIIQNLSVQMIQEDLLFMQSFVCCLYIKIRRKLIIHFNMVDGAKIIWRKYRVIQIIGVATDGCRLRP